MYVFSIVIVVLRVLKRGESIVFVFVIFLIYLGIICEEIREIREYFKILISFWEDWDRILGFYFLFCGFRR